ncbi:DUF1206 domain-containing protein [Actinokineospora fastidiosa]|uniref:DUF1206 domain-containing protein n=1 Tax=Actinokineospora fastidiosa TaxID=1816 RepID=A0A918G5N4_9PSEU|nr:DUF1206 domain-containing protein [Actinokineospora fastidiosa]GGS20011.1 hypothetical protein GCM10010171_10800 [Actinokineospora fastidiosa]
MDAERAHRSRPVQWLGRAGMVCYGAIYVVLAYLAVRVVAGARSGETDTSGALAEIASTGAGLALMWVLAAGLFAFALWQAMEAAMGFRWVGKELKRTRKRLGAAVRAGTGVSLGIVAVKLATGGGAGSGDQKQREWTAVVLDLPAGPVIVGAVAAIVIAVGVAGVVTGVRGSFMRDLDATDLPTGTQRWVRRIGRVGHIAKGVAIAIVGGLIGAAALTANPGEAGGFDTALRTLAAQPYGMVLLSVMAVGFAAFGAYCFAAARAHRT